MKGVRIDSRSPVKQAARLSRRAPPLTAVEMPRPSLIGVEVTVLVDDYAGFSRLLAEHGFSVYLSLSYDDGSKYRVLFDTGRSGRVLLENASSLRLSLEEVDAVVLSHRHYDHAGGLPALLEKAGFKPVVAHPDVVKPSYADSGGFKRFSVALPAKAWEEVAGGSELVLTRAPLELAPGAWFLGEVERIYDNSYAVKGFYTLSGGEVVEDKLLDDTGLAVRVGDKALLVAGCSHSGISNLVRKALLVTGARTVTVIGGLHLAGATAEEVERVVSELSSLGVEEIHAGHCTGLRGEAALLKAFGGRAHRIHSGYRLALPGKAEPRE